MKLSKARAKHFRYELTKKIISLVKPEDMSIEEYIIQCNLNDIDPTLDNGMFLHWVMVADGPWGIKDKVNKSILQGLKKGYLLDETNNKQMSYFCDALKQLLLQDKYYTKDLFEATMEGYPKGDLFDFVCRLNKAFGLTSKNYFGTL